LTNGPRRFVNGSGAPLARFATVAIGLLLCIPAFARPLDPEDRYKLQSLSDPQISPDGAWVAYCVSSSRKDPDVDEDDIWLVSWNGRQSLRLTNTPSSEHSPRWGPDGQLLAFLTDRGDAKAGDQIWLLDRRGGEARQLTHFGQGTGSGITSFAWSPDGLRMVFSAEVREKQDEEHPQPIVIDRLQFKSDSGGYLRGERTHLFLFNVQSGEVTPLTSGDFNELQPAWSPDGSQIVFLSKRGNEPDATNNWDLYVVDARPNSTPRQLTTSLGMDGDPDEEWGTRPPIFSPDGKQVAYVAYGAPEDAWYSLEQVSVVGLQEEDRRQPTAALDRNTIDPRWSADGQWIYFRLEDNLSVVLARVRVRDGRVERLTEPGAVVSEFDTGRAGRAGRIAVVQSTLARPSELYAVEGRELRQLSHHNDAWLQEVELAEGLAIQFKSADGLVIHGLLLAPTGAAAAGRKPAVLRIHGGPIAQHQNEFDFDWQLLAANGYVVLAPNPRGSSGRGYEFQKMLFADWGHADVPDILAAADYAVSVGIADPQRLGVGGWSYGAILTNYVISSDTRFKAATVGAGMGNMLAGYGDDMYVREWEIELGLPWEKTQRWVNLSSPFLRADRIKTPTLFLVGSEDYNVPPIGSEQMYQALRRLHVPTQLVIYPGQHHWIARPSWRNDRVRRYLEWYGRYLKPD
jgi:dipeptidyl aminopeptidase/acylaminoacyl peptidase